MVGEFAGKLGIDKEDPVVDGVQNRMEASEGGGEGFFGLLEGRDILQDANDKGVVLLHNGNELEEDLFTVDYDRNIVVGAVAFFLS